MYPREVNMNTINEQQANKQKIQLYLGRVNDFFSQINDWFKDDLEVTTFPIQVGETLGTYEAPAIDIREKGQTESLANITPKGANVILTEGMLEMKGWIDRAHFDYMINGGPQVTMVPGKKLPMFKGINQDGWYWIVNPVTRTTRFADKSLLLELITLVSDHEF
jgi:hypothetical protein